MNVSPMASVGSGYAHPANGAGSGAGVLGKNDFLKLLLAQLQNQDPLKPMEDREFIAQLAQFRSLEEMQNLNTYMMALLDMQQVSQASSLLGKTVEVNAGPGHPPVVGVVSEVDLTDGAAVLVVDGRRVYLHNVVRVR